MNWTHTIDILGQIAYGNMFNENITPEQARKELKRMRKSVPRWGHCEASY